MAIVFQEKKHINWFGIFLGIAVAGFLAAATYYLFFAPSPKIDVIVPDALQKAGQVSEIEFTDPAVILNSQSYKNLRLFVGTPQTGDTGRDNPFIPF